MRRPTCSCHRPIRRRRRAARDPRDRLAVVVLMLFGCICMAALLAPDNAQIERLLPFAAQQVAMVLGYYFGRRS